jgi:hypothetical protein
VVVRGRRGLTTSKPNSLSIDAHHLVPGYLRSFVNAPQRLRGHDAGVVYHDIKSSKRLHSLPHEILHVTGCSHVCRDEDGALAGRFAVPQRASGIFGVDGLVGWCTIMVVKFDCYLVSQGLS